MSATVIALSGLFITFISGLCTVAYGFVRHKNSRQRHDVSRSSIGSLSMGPVAVAGTVAPKDERTFSGPVSGRDCVLSEYRVDRYDRDQSHWRRVADGRESFPFYVDDGTGRVLVEPSDVTLDTSRQNEKSTTVYKRGSTPDSIRTFLDRVPGVNPPEHQSSVFSSYDYNPKRRYIERAIRAGDYVYLYGTATSPHRDNHNDETATAVITASDRGCLLISDTEQSDLAAERTYDVPLSLAAGVVLSAVSLFGLLLEFLLF